MIQMTGIVGPLHNYMDGSFRVSIVVPREMIEKVFELQKNQDGEMIVQFFTIEEARELVEEVLCFKPPTQLPAEAYFTRCAVENDKKIAETMGLAKSTRPKYYDDRVVDINEPELNANPEEPQMTKTLRSRIFLHLKNAGMENKRAKLCQNTFGVDGLSKLNEYQLMTLFELIMKDYTDTDSHAYLINPDDPYDVQIMDYSSLTARVMTMTEEGWEPE